MALWASPRRSNGIFRLWTQNIRSGPEAELGDNLRNLSAEGRLSRARFSAKKLFFFRIDYGAKSKIGPGRTFQPRTGTLERASGQPALRLLRMWQAYPQPLV